MFPIASHGHESSTTKNYHCRGGPRIRSDRFSSIATLLKVVKPPPSFFCFWIPFRCDILAEEEFRFKCVFVSFVQNLSGAHCPERIKKFSGRDGTYQSIL
jgi:hypothetical protein